MIHPSLLLLIYESLTGKNKITDLQSSMESESYSQSSSTSLPQQQQSLMEIATTAATNMQNVPACDKFAILMKQVTISMS